MNTSFYTAAVGASTQQDRMNIIANNIANVNTTGYKTKSTVFQDLMYYNMRAADPANEDLMYAGTGTRVSHTNTDFSSAATIQADGEHNYALLSDGFFMLSDPLTDDISYTRDGVFYLSLRADGYYLMTDSGRLVLDADENPITATDGVVDAEPGVFDFINKDGMESIGNNEFVPLPKNGEPILIQNAQVMTNRLEMSNVDLATEIANTVEASRAYSLLLKMVQTSDEVQQTINRLRG